ncbi:MAG: hypothetical protein GC208_10420 [Alphaproteobacteria bacterium]|nr:hypothetical protein [Alphaproteobacteria bacterium]
MILRLAHWIVWAIIWCLGLSAALLLVLSDYLEEQAGGRFRRDSDQNQTQTKWTSGGLSGDKGETKANYQP